MKVYLDMCCLKRPFDDQLQARINLESRAVEAVLAACRAGQADLIGSDALRFENSRNPNEQRKGFVAKVLTLAKETVAHNEAIEARAIALQAKGLRLLDALHLSSAEASGTNIFCTCDDGLLNKARLLSQGPKVMSPVEVLREICP